jgi:outer membrane protein assembly factor BamB
MKINSPLRPALLLAFTFFPFVTLASDWPRWRGPDNTGWVPAGEVVPSKLPAKPKMLWHFDMGEGIGSPVVAGGRVFCLDNRDDKEVLCAFDLASGTEIWHSVIDDVITDGIGSGPRGAPVVAGPRVYVQSCKGEFRCFEASDGKPQWRVNFLKDFDAEYIGEKGNSQGAARHGYTGPPIVDGERIIVGVGGPHGASVVAFDKITGKVIWKSQNDMPAYAGPVIATLCGVKQVVSFTSDGVIGLDTADGKLLWRSGVKTSCSRHITTPIVLDDMVVVSSHEAGLIGFRVNASDGGMKAQRAWVRKDLAINVASPVLVGKSLYGLGPKKQLFCADVKTGKDSWSKSGAVAGPATYISMLVMKDNLLVLGDSGNLYLIAADPNAYHLLSSTKVCGKNWCNPAYVDGKLLIRDQESLRCLELLDLATKTAKNL